MPIKLAQPKTRDELRAGYIASKGRELARLDKVLRRLTDDQRDQFQQSIATSLKASVQFFLDTRLPHETARDMYYRIQTPPKSYGMADIRASRMLEYVKPMTDYEKQLDKANWDFQKGAYDPFTVSFRKNAEAIAYKLAAKIMEEIVRSFVYKTSDKLVDLIVAYPDYEASLLHGSFHGKGFEGEIALRFVEPTLCKKGEMVHKTFKIRLSIRYNRTVYGDPYEQYPLTFHEYREETTVKGQSPSWTEPKGLNLEALHDFFTFDDWAPPPQTPKGWTTVKTGCVVLNTHGNLNLINRTTSKGVQVYTQTGGVTGLNADEIVKVVAKIAEHESYGDEPHTAYIDFPDYKTNSRVKITLGKRETKQVNDLNGYSTRKAEIRRLAFLAALSEGRFDHEKAASPK